nr:hypothetical protein [Psychrobacter sp. PraFG1]UNK06351.1 hypothetical protein MN210_07410 [Psychrobacter sp. PraFG1]
MTDRGTAKNSHRLYYGEKLIDYEVVRKANSRKLRIKVHPDQRVVVTAPMDTTQAFIQSSVNKRRAGYGSTYKILPSKKAMYCPSAISAARPSFIWGEDMCSRSQLMINGQKR